MSPFAALAPLLHLVAAAPVPAQDCFERFARIEHPSKRVLFVGNSFTFGNDLPCLVAELGLSLDSPLRLRVGMVAQDGMTLETHWRDGEASRRLREEEWDVVVLQEQSSRPVTDPGLMETYVRRWPAPRWHLWARHGAWPARSIRSSRSTRATACTRAGSGPTSPPPC